MHALQPICLPLAVAFFIIAGIPTGSRFSFQWFACALVVLSYLV